MRQSYSIHMLDTFVPRVDIAIDGHQIRGIKFGLETHRRQTVRRKHVGMPIPRQISALALDSTLHVVVLAETDCKFSRMDQCWQMCSIICRHRCRPGRHSLRSTAE